MMGNGSMECTSFSYDASESECKLDSDGAIDPEATFMGECATTITGCNCADETTVTILECEGGGGGGGTPSTDPGLFDSEGTCDKYHDHPYTRYAFAGNAIGADSGDGSSKRTQMEFNVVAGEYTYCVPGALFVPDEAATPAYPFPLCDATVAPTNTIYDAGGTFAIIKAPRGSEVTAEITSLDVDCNDILRITPLTGEETEFCTNNPPGTLKAKGSQMKFHLVVKSGSSLGAGFCATVTVV